MRQIEFKEIIFLSNYFNHHQKPVSDELYKRLKNKYLFIETAQMTDDRKKLGWGVEEYPPYVITSNEFYGKEAFYKEQIDKAEVVIIGSAPEEYIKNRIQKNKLVLKYSERMLKKGLKICKYPIRFIRWQKANPYNKNIYMLCASAYTCGDFAIYGVLLGRCFKWGYFPETKKYDIEKLLELKKQNSKVSILWTARLIDWKHPEIAIEIAERLKNDGYSFELNMIGTGEYESMAKQWISEKDLSKNVNLLGAMSPESVRNYMEKADIFLFTSDFNEGWGAVLNESMNSACAVVASHAIGAAPYLIEDGINGLLYKNGDIDGLYQRVVKLIKNPLLRENLGREAYFTMINTWNAENAAKRLLTLKDALINKKNTELFAEGPCSKANILLNGWYKK